jgi:hypothetical protein
MGERMFSGNVKDSKLVKNSSFGRGERALKFQSWATYLP